VPKKSKVAPEVVEHWPEVMDNIDIRVVPIQYMKAVEISFVDGKTWVMDLDHELIQEQEEAAAADLEESLEELLDEYQDAIEGVNFVVDIAKVKQDVTRRTKIFLKKRK
jgi:hypothetical protein